MPGHPALTRLLRQHIEDEELKPGDLLFQGENGGIPEGSIIRRAWRSPRRAVLAPHVFDSPTGKRVYDNRHTRLTKVAQRRDTARPGVQLFPEERDMARIAELMRRYRGFPLGVADASLVAVTERLKLADVATLDHRHFRALVPDHVPAFALLP